MLNIYEILDGDGNKFYPQTHEKAVKCSDGKTLDEKLNSDMKLIANITTTEDLEQITITKDTDDNTFKLRKIIVISQIRGNSSSLVNNWIVLKVNGNPDFQVNWSSSFTKTEEDLYYTNRTIAEIFGNNFIVTQNLTSINNSTIKNGLNKFISAGNNNNSTIDNITKIDIVANGKAIGTGSTIKVYGV